MAKSGLVEPVWPTVVGAIINEDADLSLQTAPAIGPTDVSTTTLPPDVTTRYGGLHDGFGGMRSV